MAIKYVEPVYKVSEKPRTLWEGGVPSGVERALGAVILFTVTQDKDGWETSAMRTSYATQMPTAG